MDLSYIEGPFQKSSGNILKIINTFDFAFMRSMYMAARLKPLSLIASQIKRAQQICLQLSGCVEDISIYLTQKRRLRIKSSGNILKKNQDLRFCIGEQWFIIKKCGKSFF